VKPKPEIIVRQRNRSLTAREREVLHLYATGLDYDAIAEQLEITRSTVGSNLTKIRAKSRAKGRADLVSLAIHEGLLKPPKRSRG
jgi:DNA-binding CsgD family transcriptional regulator